MYIYICIYIYTYIHTLFQATTYGISERNNMYGFNGQVGFSQENLGIEKETRDKFEFMNLQWSNQ